MNFSAPLADSAALVVQAAAFDAVAVAGNCWAADVAEPGLGPGAAAECAWARLPCPVAAWLPDERDSCPVLLEAKSQGRHLAVADAAESSFVAVVELVALGVAGSSIED